jgi:hypothetical protein
MFLFWIPVFTGMTELEICVIARSAKHDMAIQKKIKHLIASIINKPIYPIIPATKQQASERNVYLQFHHCESRSDEAMR